MNVIMATASGFVDFRFGLFIFGNLMSEASDPLNNTRFLLNNQISFLSTAQYRLRQANSKRIVL